METHASESTTSVLYRVNDRWYFKLPEHEDLLPYAEEENVNEIHIINFNYKKTSKVIDKLTELIKLFNQTNIKNINLEDYLDKEILGERP